MPAARVMITAFLRFCDQWRHDKDGLTVGGSDASGMEREGAGRTCGKRIDRDAADMSLSSRLENPESCIA